MRISDWSSDVCSSDLSSTESARADCPASRCDTQYQTTNAPPMRTPHTHTGNGPIFFPMFSPRSSNAISVPSPQLGEESCECRVGERCGHVPGVGEVRHVRHVGTLRDGVGLESDVPLVPARKSVV